MLSLSQIPGYDRPRERLLRLGAGALSDAELVALLLGEGSSEHNAVVLGQQLIADSGGIGRLAVAFPEELVRSPGVGQAKAARLVAAFELARRSASVRSRRSLDSPRAIAQVAAPVIAGERREKVVVLIADAANRLLRITPIASGAIDSSPLPVREVLHAVLRYDGRAFALAHNHPSGNPTPSQQDHDATESIRRAGDAAGLRFLDHVVIGGAGWRSIR